MDRDLTKFEHRTPSRIVRKRAGRAFLPLLLIFQLSLTACFGRREAGSSGGDGSTITTVTLSLSGLPSNIVAGIPFSVTVSSPNTSRPGVGLQTTSSYTGTVRFVSSDPQAMLPADYTFTAADNGSHTFTLIFKTSGPRNLMVLDQLSPTTGVSGTTQVSAAGASNFSISGLASSISAGVPGSVTISAIDSFSNIATGYTGTIHFTSSDGSATVPSDYTFNSSDAGTRSFSVTFASTGSQSLTVTDTSVGTFTNSSSLNVVPANTASLQVAGYPTSSTAGTSHSVTITAKDSLGNITPSYVGTVHFTSTDSAATLPSDYTFTGADAGVHVFSVSLKTAGNHSLTVTDTSTSSINGGASGLTVNPASAALLAVSGYPTPSAAGSSHTFTVIAKDAFNNVASGYTGTVHFTSTDSLAALPANYTFTAGDSGSHVFSAILNSTGSQSITGTDTVSSSVTGTQSGILVIAGLPDHLAVSGHPSSATAGVSQTITVTAKDAANNTVTGYSGTIQLSSSDGAATLPANYTFVAGDSGSHSFSVTLKTAGTQSITATDTGAISVNGSQSGISISPAATDKLVLSGHAATTAAGTANSFNVTARDAFNNLTPGYVGTVHFTSSDGAATLPSNYTFTVGDAGTHGFSATLKTAGTQNITGTDTLVGSINGAQTGITVTPSSATTLAVTGHPSSITAGSSNTVVVTVKDSFNNTVPGYTGTVHFTSTDAAAVLPSNYAFVAGDAGVHSFSITLKTAGTRNITVTDTVTSSITGTQSGITVNPDAVNKFAVTGYPSPAGAGIPNSFTVTAQDTYNNTVTSYTGTVGFTSSDSIATLPANYTFVAGDSGIHSFSATLKTAGVQSLIATDTIFSSITGSQSITVTPGTAATLVVSGYTSPSNAGVARTVTVTAKDSLNNTATGYTGTVHFTSTDGAATLPSDYTFVGGDTGVHTFSITLKTVGTRSVTATDTVTSSITGSQTGIVINPAAASVLTLSGHPSPVTAGSANNVTVTAKDAFNNVATGYTGIVTFTSTDTAATLPSNYTFVAGDAGVHVFSVTLKTSGSRNITATDTVTGSITGTQSGITVNSATATALVLTGFPSSVTAGSANNITVTAKDIYNNTATGYAGTVQFTSTDGAATLPANYTFVAGDSGVHVFSVTLKTTGSRTITATDTVTSSITGTQSSITVNPGTAATLTLSGYPSPVTAGSANNITVTAKDAFNNTATGYTGIVTFSSTDGSATLPSNYTFVSGDAGVKVFSVTLKTAGSRNITATDTVTSSITGAQTGITVNAAAASTLAVSGHPSSVTAGTANNITVTAKDAFNNTATGYTGTVAITSTDGAAILPSNYAFVAGDAGVKVFSVTLKTVGSRNITATDTVTSSITGSQTGITVNPGAANTLTLSGYPSPVTAGVANNVTVTAKDAYNNTATGYTGIIHFTSTDASATLPANYTFVAGDSGVKVFSVTLKTAGSRAITATDTVTSSITGTQSSITVNAASASTLALTGYPSPVTAGTASNITVTAKDSFNNTATGYTGTVTFSSTDPAATLPVNYAFVAGDAGVRVFSVTLKTVGTRNITATDTVTSSITGTQSGITVNAGAATQLVVAGYSSPSVAGVPGTFSVTAKDAYSNTATGYTGTVTFSSTDSIGTLPSNYTFVAGDAGVKSFSATLKTAGVRTLTATDTILSSITGTQSGIVINPGSAVTLTLSGFPTPTTAGVSGSVTVTARDSFNNTATGYLGTVQITSTDGAATLPANYSFVAGDSGVRSLSVTLKTAGTRNITGTDTVTSSITGTQTGIVVNPAGASTLTLSGFPSPVTAGTANNVTVTAKDAFNNTATGYVGIVTFSSTDGAATLPSNYTFVAGDAGVRSFSVTLKTAGSRNITATDTVTSSITGTQSGITVNAAAASLFIVNGHPSPVTAGSTNTITVTAKDAYSNTKTDYTGTVQFSSTDGAATLPSNYTFVVGDAGVRNFSVTLKTTGTRSVTATDTVTTSITGTQSGIVVNSATATTLSVTGYPSPVTAGTSNTLTVTARDAYNNVAIGYTGVVNFTSTDGAATLPSNYTFVAGDAGVRSFSITLKTTGTRTITATDVSFPTITGTQTGIVVNPAAASTLTLSGYPTSTTAGSSNNVTVTAKDAFGNTATGYTGIVHLTSSDGQAVLASNYTFTGADAGVHAMSVTLKTASSQSITGTDTVTSSITGTQSGITVNPAAASQLALTAYGSPRTAGTAGNVTVTAKDPYNNVATSYTGTVHLTSSDTLAVLASDYSFVGADAGVHALSVTLKTSGTQTITGTDTVTSSITGTQSGITVNAAATSTLVLTGYPSSVVAGASNNVTITAKDIYNNTTPAYTGTLDFTSNDAAAVLPADYTYTVGDAGAHTFAIVLKTAGAGKTFTATDTVTSSITGTRSSITVTAAAAATLSVTGFPNPAASGVPYSTTVTAKDAYNNTATGYTGTVHFTTTAGSSTLPSNYTYVAGDAGVHVFSITLSSRGTWSITATDTVTSSITGSQTGIVVKKYYVYVAASGSGRVRYYSLDMNDGSMSSISSVNTGSGSTPQFLATDPSYQFLYVASTGLDRVAAYTINQTNGNLTAISGQPYSVGDQPYGLNVHPNGNFLYVTNFNSGTMSAFSINSSTGALTAVSGSPFATGTNPIDVAIGSNGSHLYVANYGANNVQRYSINTSTGVPTSLGTTSVGTGPVAVRLDVNGAFLYTANYSAKTISGFTRNTSTGALTAVSGSPYTGGSRPSSMAIDPINRQYLYIANGSSSGTTDNNVTVHPVNTTTGVLSSSSSFTADSVPAGVAVDPTFKYAFVANSGDNSVSVYSINSSTGALTEVSGSPFGVNSTPIQVLVIGM